MTDIRFCKIKEKIVVLKIQKAHVISQDKKNYEIDLWLLNEIYDFLSIEFMAFKI